MRVGRRIAQIMALVMVVTTLGTDISYGGELSEYSEYYGSGAGTTGGEISPGGMEVPSITGLQAELNSEAGQITLTFQKQNCAYVEIRVNDEAIEEEWRENAYVYDIPLDGSEYRFRLIPYNEGEEAGTAVEKNVAVPYYRATLEAIEADYDLESQILLINWEGRNISSVSIYQDAQTTPLMTGPAEDDMYAARVALPPNSAHVYRIVAYNRAGEEGNSLTVDLKVGDYTPRVENLSVWYNEETRRLEIEWDDKYTAYADIFLNEEVIAEKCTAKSYSFPCELQPGANYQVTVLPYNDRKEEGEEGTENFSNGFFEVPETPDTVVGKETVQDEQNNYTGFYKPTVELRFQAQKNAVYEIYRATKDKKSAYSWIGTVKASADDLCIYTDHNVSIGNYYYKIRRTIVEDKYVTQELYTGLSDAAQVSVTIPRAGVNADLTENGAIRLTLKADSDSISGYVIYKKSGTGSYKKIATITGNEYEDTDVAFGTNYYYKARAYYYDTKTGKNYYGAYSAVCSIKNLVGSMQAFVTPISATEVKLSWTKAANAAGYEVYYKSAVKGDAYELLTTTTKLSAKTQLKSGKKYTFLVKAYRQKETGKSYFSNAEVSFQTGFAEPQGLRVSQTGYKLDVKTGILTQKSRLRWNCVYGADGYYVERYNPKTGKYEEVAELTDESETSYVVSDQVTDVVSEVQYRIRAYVGMKKAASEPIRISLKLKQPSKIAMKHSGTNLKLSWGKVTGASSYRIYRSVGRTMVYIGETSKTSYTDKGLEAGVACRYYIQAVNEKCYCASDYGVSAEYMLQPSRVKGLSVKRQKNTQAVLRWKKSAIADAYRIYVSTDGKNYKKLAEVKQGTLQYTHKKLKDNKTYYYRVTVIKNNSAGITIESKASQVKLQTGGSET